MKKPSQNPAKMVLLIVSFMLVCGVSKGQTYTAIASGNWNAATTWNGGNIPPADITAADQVVIASGYTVTMTQNVTLDNSLASITVDGTLTSVAHITLNVTSGSISGSGSVSAAELYLNPLGSCSFTGSITADTMSNAIVSLSSASQITVNDELALAESVTIITGGALTMGANSNITVAGGTLSVSGSGSLNLTNNYNVTYSALSITAGKEITGSGLGNVTIEVGSGNTVTLNSGLTVSGTLDFISGMLNVSNQMLTISGNVTGSGLITVTGGTTLDFDGSSSIGAGVMLSGTVGEFTENIGNGNSIMLGASLDVDTLNLVSGTLNLNSNNLAIYTNIMAGGAGLIASTSVSNITINTAASISGALTLSASANTVNDFNIDIGGGGSVNLGANMAVNGVLDFTMGFVNTQSNMLTITASGAIKGAGSNAYVITGSGGNLTMTFANVSTTDTFQVGTSDYYLPAAIDLNSGSGTGAIGVNVSPGVYYQGISGGLLSNTQPTLDATWNFTNNIGSNLNANMSLMWVASSNVGVNGFVTTGDYISHYTAGAWDVSAASNASLNNNLYSVTRANITSMSPFAVFDQQTVTGIEETLADPPSFNIYPNPATDYLYISSAGALNEVMYVEVYNILGQMVAGSQIKSPVTTIPVSSLAPGNYFVKIYNENFEVVQKLSKL